MTSHVSEVRDWIFKEVKSDTKFVKSCHIARELGLTPREVGYALSQLSRSSVMISIERWNKSTPYIYIIEVTDEDVIEVGEGK